MSTMVLNIKVKVLLLVTGFFLLTFQAPAMASFEKAMEVYTSGDFVKAKSSFEAMAAIGDRASLFNLGVMYFRGETVDPDPLRAYVLMKIANEGLEDESFARTIKVIHGRLTEQQVGKIDSLHEELVAIYGIKEIEDRIFPKLLNDEDCLPELKPLNKGKLVYPTSQLNRGNMGLVFGEYTISPEGYPREINITSSTGRAFTKQSIISISRRLYEPLLNGQPIHNHRMALIFQIDMNANSRVQIEPIIKELDELESKSEEGDVVAQYMYGRSLNNYRYFRTYLQKMDLQYKTANEWYLKSAKQGLTNAQFEIGRNMFEGRGCEVDEENGFKWIKAAALGGHSPAQTYLASRELSKNSLSKNKARSVVGWLRNAVQSDDYASKVLLAWELATSPEESLLNPEEALTLIEDEPGTYEDEIRILETKAAAYARNSNFKKAVKLQKTALRKMEKKKWQIPKVVERLEIYQKENAYTGSYY